jgi:hypothetical protein
VHTVGQKRAVSSLGKPGEFKSGRFTMEAPFGKKFCLLLLSIYSTAFLLPFSSFMMNMLFEQNLAMSQMHRNVRYVVPLSVYTRRSSNYLISEDHCM